MMHTPLSATNVVLIGLVTFAAVTFEVTWAVVRLIGTMAHEGAHALIASLSGRGVQSITIKPNADGLTTPVRGGALPGTIAIGVVGYVGPSAFGLGAAQLIESGYILSVFWVALVLLAVLLLAARWSFAFVAVPAAGALAFTHCQVRARAHPGHRRLWPRLAAAAIRGTHGRRARSARRRRANPPGRDPHPAPALVPALAWGHARGPRYRGTDARHGRLMRSRER